MRKQIALVLVAVSLVLCMTMSVGAESTTISVVVPEPNYQMTIPADIRMEYKADRCTLNAPSISQSSGITESAYLTVSVSHSGAFSSQNTSTTIPFTFYARTDSGLSEWSSGTSLIYDRMEDGSVSSAGHMANGATPSGFELQISDSAWEKANPGTYRATVTFTAQLAFSE